MEIILFKGTDARISEDDSGPMRRFLFEMVDGATDKDKKAWRRFVRSLNESPAGSYFTIVIKRQRNSQFHRLCMAVVLAVFKSQETFEDFSLFRQFLKVGAGFVDYIPDAETGELRAIPKSQSYEDSSEEDVRQFFEDMCTFMRSPNCCATLWPKAPIEQSMAGMTSILQQFDQPH